DLARRMAQHSRHKRWWPDVAHIDVEWFDTREAALAAERLAIVNERPTHNVVHNADNAGRVGEVRWFCTECNGQIKTGGRIVIQAGQARDMLRARLAGARAGEHPQWGWCEPLHG